MTDNQSNIGNEEKLIENESIILKYISILIKYKKFLIISTLTIGLIATILMFFVIKPLFYSSGIVKVSSKTSSITGLLSGGNVPDIGGLDELSGSSGPAKEIALYSQILNSRRCIEETINKFNLMEVYDHKYYQKAIADFRENVLDISKDTKSGTMEIGVYDFSPERAKEIASFLIVQLNKINTELNVLNAKNNREFIEQRYNIIKKELKQAEDSLKEYQQVYGLAPDITTKAVLQTTVQLEVEIKAEEVKLELLQKILSPDQSEIKMQEEKISKLKQQLQNIENSDDNNLGLLHLKDSPVKIMNFLRLQRNVEIQNKLLVFILPIFEQAKIEEKKEMPSVLVLDQPNVPELKKKPKRVITIFLSIFGSFVFFSICIILYEMLMKELISSLKKRRNV
jgi:tyrosine-protein kinase Etk/Wzc